MPESDKTRMPAKRINAIKMGNEIPGTLSQKRISKAKPRRRVVLQSFFELSIIGSFFVYEVRRGFLMHEG
jgi:hypothetical protein